MTLGGRNGRSTAAVLTWLAHPATLGALAVLLVNDHLLKAAYPGWLTGKLSDAAGLVLAPPLLALLAAALVPAPGSGRLAAAAVGATAAGFAVVKATTAGAATASAAWSAVAGPAAIRADRTDLLVLPAAAAGWWAWRRTTGDPDRTAGRRRLAGAVASPLALLAVLATSATNPPREAVGVQLWDRGVAVLAGGVVLVSADGGRTWTEPSDQVQYAHLHGRPAGWTATRACVPGQPRRCYRVLPGQLAVQESVNSGASWQDAWRVDEEQRRRLAGRYDGLADPGTHLASVAVAVRRVGAGYEVVVADGRDGVLLRDRTGSWRRLGLPAYTDRFGDPRPGVPAEPLAPRPAVDYRLGSARLAGAIVAGWLVALLSTAAAAVRGTSIDLDGWCVGVAALGTAVSVPFVTVSASVRESSIAVLELEFLAAMFGLILAVLTAANTTWRGWQLPALFLLVAGTSAAVGLLPQSLVASPGHAVATLGAVAVVAGAAAIGLGAAAGRQTRRAVLASGSGDPPWPPLRPPGPPRAT